MIPACAGVAPMEKMVKLESTISNARQAEAIVYAPLELKFAEDKYEMAQDAIADKDYDVARQLADEALMDAQFAEVKALSVKAEKDAQEMRESIETLRSELNRIQSQ
jgi:predicted lipid-binding transport protein (Tim44 family)